MSQFDIFKQLFIQAKGFDIYLCISAIVLSVMNKSCNSFTKCIGVLFESFFFALLIEIMCFLAWIFHLKLGVTEHGWGGRICLMTTHALCIFVTSLSFKMTTFAKMDIFLTLLELLVMILAMSLLLKLTTIGFSWIFQFVCCSRSSISVDEHCISSILQKSTINEADPVSVLQSPRYNPPRTLLRASPSGDHCEQKNDIMSRMTQNRTLQFNRNLEIHANNENLLLQMHRAAGYGDTAYNLEDQVVQENANQTGQQRVNRNFEQQRDVIRHDKIHQGLSLLKINHSPNIKKTINQTPNLIRQRKVPYSPRQRQPNSNRSTGGEGDTDFEPRVEGENQVSSGVIEESNLVSNTRENENSSEIQYVSRTRSGLIYSRFSLNTPLSNNST